MKFLKYTMLSGLMALSLTSCSDWLDVNVDPDHPNNETILVENRLPWMQKQFTYTAGCAGTRTFATCGGFYSNNTYMNAVSVTWTGPAGITATPYQTWFVGVASNINDLYEKAKGINAYHYMAAADVIHALGFMEMLDIYGEMPYAEALSQTPAPAYSRGKEIWQGCLAKLDEAIELFGKQQPESVTPLSLGDIWNGGDTQKWIKLCYGLKARWLLRVSKNSDYYDPEAILDCIAKGPQSNSDNSYQLNFDVKGDQTDFLLSDPVQTNGTWNTAAYGKNQWTSKYYLDLLTNLRGAGVEDPRTDKIIPMSMTNIKFDASGKIVDYDWRRSKGVDLYGEAKRLVAGGATSIAVQSLALTDKTINYAINNAQALNEFVSDIVNIKGYEQVASSNNIKGGQVAVEGNNVSVCYPAGAWYVNSSNYVLAGDTAYVNLNCGSQNTNNGAWGLPVKDMCYHSNDKAAALTGAISGTGSFQIYPVSDFLLSSYHEMCFIKAEVMMRKGKTSDAYTAYKDGIQANMDWMQAKLKIWESEGYNNPSMTPMNETEIANYMNSGAVAQSAGELTMSDIMLQKYIAMGFSLENWVDMRRFNYSAGNVGDFGVIYPGYNRTPLFAGSAYLRGSNPQDVDYFYRRWRLPNLELNYNATQAYEANANAFKDWVWGIPVWWDCASDAEYEAGLK